MIFDWIEILGLLKCKQRVHMKAPLYSCITANLLTDMGLGFWKHFTPPLQNHATLAELKTVEWRHSLESDSTGKRLGGSSFRARQRLGVCVWAHLG